MTTPVTPEPDDPTDTYAKIDQVVAVIGELRRLIRFLRWALAIAVVATVVLGSGWWLTAQDHSATHHNGAVADCRSAALASRLDDFSSIVSPDATAGEKADAASRIEAGPTLTASYRECSTDR